MGINKKGLSFDRPFNSQASLHISRKKAFEKNPKTQSGQLLLASKNPVEAGLFDPSRPRFPE
jgi:hypothetical protein